jgi:hypothetical protein
MKKTLINIILRNLLKNITEDISYFEVMAVLFGGLKTVV